MTQITIDPRRLARFERIDLKSGGHASSRYMCAMEAAAYIAGEKHSDHPECVSPVIAAFMRSWNDSLPTDEDRNRLLKPLVPLTLGTRTTDQDDGVRAWMATDWSVRVQAPAWLDLAGLTEEAKGLRALPEIVDGPSAHAATALLEGVREKAAAAYAAAVAAAYAAAYDAAYDAAVAAARAAAYAAAYDAAYDAAVAAARAAAYDAAVAAARAAAWAAARAAARAAAGDAAMERLAPTVATLQESAQELVRRMCEVGRAA